MKKNKKITLVVHNLSTNPIVRAYPIALALIRLGYEIEIVGFLIGKNEIYHPYADKFNYKTIFIKDGGLVSYLRGFPKLLRLISGDIIYAFKPRMTSFFVGLIKSGFGLKRKLILDAEDDELFFIYKNSFQFIYYFFLRGWNNPNSHPKLLLLHLFLFPARIRTVVSTKLQKRYGGTIILHGPDEKIFNPQNYNSSVARRELNLPKNKMLILFAGMPHTHKGIEIIIEAMKKLNSSEFVFVCAGPKDSDWFIKAKQELGERCILLGTIPNSKMPLLLSAVDIIPILQINNKFTESQMPAKLFEAMAMEKIIIASDASDIGKVLGKDIEEKRGFIVEDVDSFIAILLSILKDPNEAYLRSKLARKYFLEEASVSANEKKLKRILENI